MTSLDLGTLEQVDLRELWKHEERDFTPWLADNLHRLNATLEMNLELVDISTRNLGPGALTFWPRIAAAEPRSSSRTS